MEWILDLWSPLIILLAAFVIGWGAETAQTFIPRAVALSILAWLQTLPEFAVEAAYAWSQNRHMMIANLTGSLRLLVGLGWPMIFFVHFFFQGVRHRKMIKEIHLEEGDALGVFFLFISIAYFMVILWKNTLTSVDSVVLIALYVAYLGLAIKLPGGDAPEEHDDLPWIGKVINGWEPIPKYAGTVFLFVAGGVALYLSVHPFIDVMAKYAMALGVTEFVFVQWVAPFLSEFPEKVSAFNWARQSNKASMAMMNMVNSNINQWTMLAAMIPLVFNLSLGSFEPIVFDKIHHTELALTIVQSALGGLLLLDLKFSIIDATAIFVLWFVQFLWGDTREEITYVYLAWIAYEVAKILYHRLAKGQDPKAWGALRQCIRTRT